MREIEGYCAPLKSLLDKFEEEYKSDVTAICKEISKKVEFNFE